MKKYIIFIIVQLFSYLIYPQINEPGCSVLTTETNMDLSQKGGRFVTSSGTLKVLVVFAKFKNDNTSHNWWPSNSYPTEMSTFIDPNSQTNSTQFLNLTNYFNQMSYGNFKVIGVAVGQETPYEMSHYIPAGGSVPDRIKANKDILLAVDSQIDYTQFDNWTFNNNYVHSNVPDGVVDMVIVIWRGLVFSQNWSGEASLGYGADFNVENNQKTIKMGFGSPTPGHIDGSGVTIQYWGERPRERNLHVCIHELAHWLIGGVHPYGNWEHSFWGMLTFGSEGICANSFERERVAWINPTSIQGPILSAPMSDYITTPCSYKYHPTNGGPTEMFYFENHQYLSVYDNGTSNQNDKGIFILHVETAYYEGDVVKLITANGFNNWTSPYNSTCWGNVLPALYKTGYNRNGYGNRDKIVTDNQFSSFLYAYLNPENILECNDWMHGYGFTNSFTPAYNDVFSPWSNPPAKCWNGQSTDFLMEVINQSGNIVTARFAIQNAIGGKPSKPPLGWNPAQPNYLYGWVYLSWNPTAWDNLPSESDINWSELQRKIGNNGTWTTVYSGPNLIWSDHSVTYDPNGDTPVYFRVRVRDSQQKWSIWSDLYNTKMISGYENTGKIISNNYQIVPDDNSLSANYPNPFNPTTLIKYSILENSRVELKVFDVLGREIAELVNDDKPAGYYEVEFNASNLASGVYFYRIQAGDFVDTKKMILMK